MGSYKCCIFFTRKFRWRESRPPADVAEKFAEYADGGVHMNSDGLRRFLAEVQGDAGVTVTDAERIMEQARQLRHGPFARFTKSTFTVDDLFYFLFSEELNPPIRPEVHHDMTAPLSHYYIYTGHNSYLTGNQLSSDCSDVPIINALKRGVRVIELDMWPNSTRDDIDILHGRTLTSPVKLITCLKSIKEYAFYASPYPVIITLEDHLTPDLQAKVAKMVTETFGDMLYFPDSECSQKFKSPEYLKNRIIISTKPPKEYLESKSLKDTDDTRKSKGSKEEDEEWGKEVPDLEVHMSSYCCSFRGSPKLLHYNKKDCCKQNQDDDDDKSDDYDDDDNEVKYRPPQYKGLITIQAGKPKGHISNALKVDPDKVRRLSLNEQELANAAASHGTEVVRFTQRNILRIYPKGTRIKSSNYNPYLGWIHGAQMVAFNMQGYGKSLWLMHGFFRANGGCGYVKKPEFLMKIGPNNEVFDPKIAIHVKKNLKVKVYLGDGWFYDFKQTYFDAFSPPDFYTRVGIAGVPADNVMKRTKAVEDNWAPTWDEEFTFPLTVPELAVLRIEVHEYDMSEKDDFGGQVCLPVQELRPGIRLVPLFDRKGVKYRSVKLLMRFEFV